MLVTLLRCFCSFHCCLPGLEGRFLIRFFAASAGVTRKAASTGHICRQESRGLPQGRKLPFLSSHPQRNKSALADSLGEKTTGCLTQSAGLHIRDACVISASAEQCGM